MYNKNEPYAWYILYLYYSEAAKKEQTGIKHASYSFFPLSCEELTLLCDKMVISSVF